MRNTSPLIPYKGFLIDGSVMFGHPNRGEWRSMGTVYDAKRSPVTEIRRIEGPLVTSKEDAIKLGLELANQWVDEQGIGKDKMFHACDMQSGVFPVTRRALF